MRFLLTLNIYSNKSLKPLHQMTVEHPSESLEEFVDALTGRDFIVVSVVYVDEHTNERTIRGQVALNYNAISKIVPLTER
jgi:hypothetical protein